MLLADPYARKKSRNPSKNRVWNFFDPSKSFAGDLSSKTQCSQWEKPESATTTASEHRTFALYEAYGTRPYEWGDDPDNYKANTKEEESDLNLLNEGMRYRDLETGVFLTRDPIGYADGPNRYCYVHCNPITHFDLLGLIDVALFDRNERGDLLSNPMLANAEVFKYAAKNIGVGRGVANLQEGVDTVSTLSQGGEVIDKVVIMDHGPEGGGMQDLGDSAIDPYDSNTEKLYQELGGLVKEGGYIEHLGCQTGKDLKSLQKYANIAGKTVVAYTEQRC